MREVNIYSERLNSIEQEQEKSFHTIDTDPAQFDPRVLRSHLNKELFGQLEEEEELMEMH